RLNGTGVRRAAIERPDGPVVDALLEAGFEVVVVASRSVKALRVRYGSAGNKSDRTDAYVLADCLRTDGHRWASLQPDSPATATLRSHVRARKDLVEHRVAIANQLRAHLNVVFPGPVGLFSDLDSPISLAFLRRFPSAGKAAWLSEKRLAAWLRSQGYGGRRSAADLYAHLTQAPQGLMGAEGDARSSVTAAFVTLLETIDTLHRTRSHWTADREERAWCSCRYPTTRPAISGRSRDCQRTARSMWCCGCSGASLWMTCPGRWGWKRIALRRGGTTFWSRASRV